jgi:membrane protein DedA with SNARE-associated domain
MRKTGSKKVLALLLVIAFIAFIYLANPVGFIMSRLDTLGYVGVFLIMLLSSATIILPAPGLAGVVIAGAFLNPFWVGVAGGTGSALGELSGYFAGFGGKVIIERKRRKVS